MKKNKIILSFVCLFLCLQIMAQGGNKKHFDADAFRARVESYISQKAGLTKEEAEKFFPIFHEKGEKQWQISRQIFKLKRKRPNSEASDKEYENILEKISALNVQMAELEKTYYKRMCKAIPAHKVYAAVLAEDDFHRQALSKFNRDRKGGPERKDKSGKW